jgi:hypothetical protein
MKSAEQQKAILRLPQLAGHRVRLKARMRHEAARARLPLILTRT